MAILLLSHGIAVRLRCYLHKCTGRGHWELCPVSPQLHPMYLLPFLNLNPFYVTNHAQEYSSFSEFCQFFSQTIESEVVLKTPNNTHLNKNLTPPLRTNLSGWRKTSLVQISIYKHLLHTRHYYSLGYENEVRTPILQYNPGPEEVPRKH